MKTKLAMLLAFLAVAWPAADAAADDWPTWRGPNRNAICRETRLLQKWPEGGPKLLWQAKGIGVGYSGPAVVGNILYTMGNKGPRATVFALDIDKGGRIIWAAGIAPVKYKRDSPGTRSTPTVDGNRLYALSAGGMLACLDRDSGQMLWSADYVSRFDGVMPRWAFAESVLIDGDKLLCTPGGPKGSIVALDKTNGKLIWAAKIGDKASYSSIVKAHIAGVKQYVAFTADRVVGVRADNGELLWDFKDPDHTAYWGDVNAITPVVSAGTVYASTDYGVGGGLAKIVKTEAGFQARKVWFSKELKNHHGGVILLDGALYGCDNPGSLTCLDHKTGKVLWKSKQPGKCSVLYADGMLYCRDEKGPISLVKASPKAYELRGRFNQPNRSKQRAWPHPVIANGKLYIRDQNILLCYDIRAPR